MPGPLELLLGGEAGPFVVIDHAAGAVNRLPAQFKGKAGIEALLTALTTPMNELELIIWSLIIQRTIEFAIEAQLDVIGKIVWQHRDGLSDDIYRRYIKASIATQQSHGLVTTLIKIAKLVLGDTETYVEIEQMPIATVVVTISERSVTTEVANALMAFLTRAVAGGVRLDLQTTIDDPASFPVFTWDHPDEGFGWDDAYFMDVLTNT